MHDDAPTRTGDSYRNLRTKLVEMGEGGSRGEPVVFAGREDILERVLRASQSLPPRGRHGKTIVIEGAPGAGKSALIGELEKRLATTATRTIVCGTVPSKGRVARLWAEVCEALTGSPTDESHTTQTQETRGGISLGPITFGRRQAKSVTSTPIDNSDAVAARRGADAPFQSGEGVVVFIDEIQNINQSEHAEAVRLILDLHTQRRIPTLLVCAGLSSSADQLEAVGLTRPDEDCRIRLGALTENETLDGSRGALLWARERGVVVSENALDRWGEAIAVASQGWPHHLSSYLNAMWITLGKHTNTPDPPSLDQADVRTVLNMGDRNKKRYYDDRINRSKVPVEVVGALHARLRDGRALSEWDAIRILDTAITGLAHSENLDAIRQFFPTSRVCLSVLVNKGLVSFNSEGACVSPIPNLSAHILAKCEKRGVFFKTNHSHSIVAGGLLETS